MYDFKIEVPNLPNLLPLEFLQMHAGRVGVSIELTSNHLTYIWNMKRNVTSAVFDHEAAKMPEMVTRKMLLGGKYATVSTLKLAPGEKRVDPIKGLLQIRDEIVREAAEKVARQAAKPTDKSTRNKAA